MCGCPPGWESARSSSMVSKARMPSELADGDHFSCQDAARAGVAAGSPTAAEATPPSAAPSRILLDVLMTLITPQLFVHDQEGSEAVEVVGGPGAGDVVGVVADVRADGDVGEVGTAVRAEGDLPQDVPVA